MSLRDSYEQSLYETWSFDVVDACKAAGVPCPTDFAMRWHLGHSVEDIVREMGGVPVATIEQLPRCVTPVRKLDPAIWGEDAAA